MLGWCMWQVMHCDVGIARVKLWRIGWPLSFATDAGSTGSPAGPFNAPCAVFAAIVGSTVALCPSRP